jgi:aminoglycoside phosphotransferase
LVSAQATSAQCSGAVDYGLRGRLDVHVELEREVRKLALAAGVDYESALAEAERILRNAQQNDREPGPSY